MKPPLSASNLQRDLRRKAAKTGTELRVSAQQLVTDTAKEWVNWEGLGSSVHFGSLSNTTAEEIQYR